ncbi:hypothetical protein RHGRI_014825 [Rhododendron griersonianum]|uniref:HAT C-terminal dimerisation domain-containing protein n=1 Tax=Rhododendron griersonianum TaxID=479676 RepID=A0AAV6KAX9_9ERIC|nr:hypothetical protein RHGRI_014825 [Rhododendron griersonianum]
MKNHLAGTHNKVCECPQVSEEVKEFFLEYLKGKNKKQAANLECFDEEEDVGVNSKSKGTMDAYVTKGKKKDKQLTLNEMVKKREPVIRDICRFQYSETFKADREVRKGLYTTIERMYPDMDTRIIVDEQLEKFKNAEGMFGMDMAKLTRDKKQLECKELQRLAIRVLSGTCSATGCERNWSIFDIVHSKRRNRLETQRMNALVFVKYNIQLELRQEKRQKMGDTYDPICLSDMESDDEWITEKEGPVLPVDHSLMDIEECFKDDGTVGKKRKRGPRNLNAYGRKKGKKKASQLDDEDEIEVLDDNEVIELEGEEEEEEEEFDEATMADDNDDDDVEELDLEDD